MSFAGCFLSRRVSEERGLALAGRSDLTITDTKRRPQPGLTASACLSQGRHAKSLSSRSRSELHTACIAHAAFDGFLQTGASRHKPLSVSPARHSAPVWGLGTRDSGGEQACKSQAPHVTISRAWVSSKRQHMLQIRASCNSCAGRCHNATHEKGCNVGSWHARVDSHHQLISPLCCKTLHSGMPMLLSGASGNPETSGIVWPCAA